MGNLWIIVEDNPERTKALIIALENRLDAGDKVLCILAREDRSEKLDNKKEILNERTPNNAGIEVDNISSIDSIKSKIENEIEKDYSKAISILDKKLGNVGDLGELDEESAKELWSSIVEREDTLSVAHLYSTIDPSNVWKSNIQDKYVNDEYNERISITNTSLQVPSEKMAKRAHETIEEAEETLARNISDLEKCASLWRYEEWRELRSESSRVCKNFAPKGKAHKFSAHHLTHGGYDKKEVVQQENLIGQLRKRLLGTGVSGIRRLPDDTWLEVDSVERAWDRPPVRAIAQFDDGGKDLTAILNLVERDVRRKYNNFNLNIKLINENLKHDYLWFNASALAMGLFKLSKSFFGEVKDFSINNPNRKLIQLNSNWLIEEKRKGDRTGFRLEVNQSYVVESDAPSDPQFRREYYKIPRKEETEGEVRKAYKFFENTGGEVERKDNGSLVVKVFSQCDEHPFVWRLDRRN